jgi:hypothetical protein
MAREAGQLWERALQQLEQLQVLGPQSSATAAEAAALP